MNYKNNYTESKNKFIKKNWHADLVTLILFCAIAGIKNIVITELVYRCIRKLEYDKIASKISEILSLVNGGVLFYVEGVILSVFMIYLLINACMSFTNMYKFRRRKISKIFIGISAYEIPPYIVNVYKLFLYAQYVYFIIYDIYDNFWISRFILVTFNIMAEYSLVMYEDSEWDVLNVKIENDKTEYFRNDNALCHKQLLRRDLRNLCERIVDDIVSRKDYSKNVVALTGEWGSGKTSIINSVIYELCKRQMDAYFICRINTLYFEGEKDILRYVNQYISMLRYRYLGCLFNPDYSIDYIELIIGLISDHTMKASISGYFGMKERLFTNIEEKKKKFQRQIRSLLKYSRRKNIILVFDNVDRMQEQEKIYPVLNEVFGVDGILCIVLKKPSEKEEEEDLEKYINYSYEIPRQQKHYEVADLESLGACLYYEKNKKIVSAKISQRGRLSIFEDSQIHRRRVYFDIFLFWAIGNRKTIKTLLLSWMEQYVLKSTEFPKGLKLYENEKERPDAVDWVQRIEYLCGLSKEIIIISHNKRLSVKNWENSQEKEELMQFLLENGVFASKSDIDEACRIARKLTEKIDISIDNAYEKTVMRVDEIIKRIDCIYKFTESIDRIYNNPRKLKAVWGEAIFNNQNYLECIIGEIEDEKIRRTVMEMISACTYNSMRGKTGTKYIEIFPYSEVKDCYLVYYEVTYSRQEVHQGLYTCKRIDQKELNATSDIAIDTQLKIREEIDTKICTKGLKVIDKDKIKYYDDIDATYDK